MVQTEFKRFIRKGVIFKNENNQIQKYIFCPGGCLFDVLFDASFWNQFKSIRIQAG
jgi:hypothetical protein